MASLKSLLKPEEVELSLSLIKSVTAKIPNRAAPARVAPAETHDVSVVKAKASISNVPELPVDDPYKCYAESQYHPHVLATFISTAMAKAGYSPNVKGQDAAKEAEGFSKFLTVLLQKFSQFVRLKESSSERVTNKSHDYQPLLDSVANFVKDGAEIAECPAPPTQIASRIVGMVKDAAHSLTASQTSSAEKCMYTIYDIQGSDRDPMTSIYYSSVRMTRKSDGKQNAADNEFAVMRATFQLISANVSMHASTFAKASVKDAGDFVDWLNSDSK